MTECSGDWRRRKGGQKHEVECHYIDEVSH